MAFTSRSTVLAIIKETTAGVLEKVTSGSQFTVLRQGFSVNSALETVQSDELVNDIGASEGFVTKEAPTASIPKYFKHSGVEGQAPDYGVMIESAMGSVAAIATERSTTSGSTAGTASARAVLKLAAGGSDYPRGRALLIKDGANGYSIRNSVGYSTNDVSLNFNLAAAPASGVALGKAVHYAPVATGHPTYSLHGFQAADSSSSHHEAIAGCRTVGMSAEFPANELGSLSFEIEGQEAFRNPIVIDADNCKIDFDIGGSALLATLSQGTYKTPMELAREVTSKMTAAAGDTITGSFDSLTGKFGIDAGGSISELNLLWNTGANTADGAHTTLGYSSAADDTGSLTYTADSEQTYGPGVTPEYDDAKPAVVKANELFIGDFYRKDVRSFSNVSFNISTPKTDEPDGTSESGIGGSVVLERQASFSATISMKKHEIEDFDALLNNTTMSLMFNHGQKLGGNWVAGTCVNLFMDAAKLNVNTISDSDGLVVKQIEVSGFVTGERKDIHINLL